MHNHPAPPEKLVRASLQAYTLAPGWSVCMCVRGVWRARACEDAADAVEALCAIAEDAAAAGQRASIYLIDPIGELVTVVDLRG